MIHPASMRRGASTGRGRAAMVFVVLLPASFGTVRAAASGSAEPPMRGEYRADLIYGAGHIAALGCPEEDRPACVTDWARYLHGFGLRSTRKTISWLHTEPEQGRYDWTRTDNSLPAAAAEGMTIVALVADTPVWASHPDLRRILDERDDGRFVVCLQNEEEYWPDFERWLETAVRRYGHIVDYYEIWNEPDGMCGMYPIHRDGEIVGIGVGGNPEWYAELLKRASRVIRAHDPVAKVAVGGFECKHGLQTDFVEGIYERGCAPYFDAIAIHPYGTPFGEPLHRRWMATVRGVMAAHGDGHKPFWITEYNNEGHGELDMSFTVRRKHRLMRETPWIAIAIPLGTQYMFYGREAVNRPLRAIRRMQQTEFEARREWRQDFEASDEDLFAQWEWRAMGADSGQWPETRILDAAGRNGSRALEVLATPDLARIRVFFLPYVRSDDPTVEAWYAVRHESGHIPIEVRVGVECLDILQDERLSEPVPSHPPDDDGFHRVRFRIRDAWPDWADAGVNMVWLEFSSETPGFAVSVDDVHVF